MWEGSSKQEAEVRGGNSASEQELGASVCLSPLWKLENLSEPWSPLGSSDPDCGIGEKHANRDVCYCPRSGRTPGGVQKPGCRSSGCSAVSLTTGSLF